MPVDEVRQYLKYEPVAGSLHWARDMSQRVKDGDMAGTLNSHGYVQIIIKGMTYLGHRVGWALTHGEWPAVMIDHINGTRCDNRLANLRLATGAQNQANRGVRKDNKTGLRGVKYHEASKTFSASIQVGGFATAEQAAEEYARLAKFCYGEFSPTPALIDAARRLRGMDRA